MGKNQEKIGAALARIDEGMENISTDKVFKEPEDKAEYHEKEGGKAMKKVITGFRIAHVFDISDADGSDEQLPVLVKGLEGDDERVQEIYGHLKGFIIREHKVIEASGTAAKGSYNLETGDIMVRSDVPYFQKVKTILHEYAHAVDFQMHPGEDVSRNKRELIAESTAFVVCERLGLDTSSYSMSYIKSWLKDREELKTVAGSVQKVAAKIIDSLAESGDSFFFCLKEEP